MNTIGKAVFGRLAFCYHCMKASKSLLMADSASENKDYNVFGSVL